MIIQVVKVGGVMFDRLKNLKIVKKLKEIAAGGLNEMEVMGSISSVVKDRLRKEGLTVTHKRELRHNLSISYDLIEW